MFTGAFAILRYKDIHYTQTIYLSIAGSTHYSISYLNRRLYEAYLTRSNDYWSIIIWLAKHVMSKVYYKHILGSHI